MLVYQMTVAHQHDLTLQGLKDLIKFLHRLGSQEEEQAREVVPTFVVGESAFRDTVSVRGKQSKQRNATL